MNERELRAKVKAKGRGSLTPEERKAFDKGMPKPNLHFKRNGHVMLDGHCVGFLWKPDPRKRFQPGVDGVWNFQWTDSARVGGGLRLIKDLGLPLVLTDARQRDLKDALRQMMKPSKVAKLVRHCEDVEAHKAANPPPTPSEADKKMLDKLNAILGTVLS